MPSPGPQDVGAAAGGPVAAPVCVETGGLPAEGAGISKLQREIADAVAQRQHDEALDSERARYLAARTERGLAERARLKAEVPWLAQFEDVWDALDAAVDGWEPLQESIEVLLRAARDGTPTGVSVDLGIDPVDDLQAWAWRERARVVGLDRGPGSPEPLLIRVAARECDPLAPLFEALSRPDGPISWVRDHNEDPERVAEQIVREDRTLFEGQAKAIARRRVVEGTNVEPSRDFDRAWSVGCPDTVVGASPPWVRALRLSRMSAVRAAQHMRRSDTDDPMPSAMLLIGPSGAGKEVLATEAARVFGLAGGTGKIVPVNCGTLPEGMAEEEIFGVEDGYTTGVPGRKGMLEEASGGCLFLDEVHRLPSKAQGMLMRTLQTGLLERLGSPWGARRPVTVFVIAATHREPSSVLGEETGPFPLAPDLFHRLAGTLVRVPSLVERGESDVELLRRRFERDEHLQEDSAFTPTELRALFGYAWPGNVRELRRAVRLRAMLRHADLRAKLRHVERCAFCGIPGHSHGQPVRSLDDQALVAAVRRMRELTADEISIKAMLEHLGGIGREQLIGLRKIAETAPLGRSRAGRKSADKLPPCDQCALFMRGAPVASASATE